jgi:membrane protease YdiL (CAAX protease family)
MIEYAGQIALVLFIIWRSNDPPSRFGLKPFRIGRDLFGGIVICIGLRVAHYLLWWGLRIVLSRNDYWKLVHSGIGSGSDPPFGAFEFALLAVMCLASGFVQELVMRAYLITRFEELLGSTPIAVLLSTVLFMCYHGYQGTAGVIGVALFGLIQAVIFCLFRRLAPIALAHAVNNFIAIGM